LIRVEYGGLRVLDLPGLRVSAMSNKKNNSAANPAANPAAGSAANSTAEMETQ
jgi:hypothetical protein